MVPAAVAVAAAMQMQMQTPTPGKPRHAPKWHHVSEAQKPPAELCVDPATLAHVVRQYLPPLVPDGGVVSRGPLMLVEQAIVVRRVDAAAAAEQAARRACLRCPRVTVLGQGAVVLRPAPCGAVHYHFADGTNGCTTLDGLLRDVLAMGPDARAAVSSMQATAFSPAALPLARIQYAAHLAVHMPSALVPSWVALMTDDAQTVLVTYGAGGRVDVCAARRSPPERVTLSCSRTAAALEHALRVVLCYRTASGTLGPPPLVTHVFSGVDLAHDVQISGMGLDLPGLVLKQRSERP